MMGTLKKNAGRKEVKRRSGRACGRELGALKLGVGGCPEQVALGWRRGGEHSRQTSGEGRAAHRPRGDSEEAVWFQH